MLVLNKSQTAKALTHAACIPLIKEAMEAVSQRDVIMPLRQYLHIPGSEGKLTAMTGFLGGEMGSFGLKIVSKFPRDHKSPHGTHVGMVIIFDRTNGLPVGMLHGGELTAIRTSATSAFATDLLALPDASKLLIVGAGEEARHHLQAINAVRKFEKISVWARNPDRAHEFATKHSALVPQEIEVSTDLASAASDAHIICTVTSAKEPFFNAEWLQPGTHINLVGAAIKDAAEADWQTVCAGPFYTDFIPSAMDQAGELLAAIDRGAFSEEQIAGEIGQVSLGQRQGRQSREEITIYKSLGVSAQDLAAGLGALTNAKNLGLGQDIDLSA
ncbi:MAG: ornithine cyclodeaminase family protein [Erythrobacter sp.]